MIFLARLVALVLELLMFLTVLMLLAICYNPILGVCVCVCVLCVLVCVCVCVGVYWCVVGVRT